MNLSDFYFELPDSLIAQYPTDRRSFSRLLVVDKQSGKVEHRRFLDIGDYLKAGDVIVFNNTKVVKARLLGKRKSGGKLELLVFKDFEQNCYLMLVKGNVKDGEEIIVGDFKIKLLHLQEGLFKTDLDDVNYNELVTKYGKVPLPPYIKRQASELDEVRYQTVFGSIDGAVAAPTAALHFDDELIGMLKFKGVDIVQITLHVGVGTFLPVKSENVSEHKMLPEFYEIGEMAAKKINEAKRERRKIVFCGTTTVRAVESSAKNGFVVAGQGKTDIFIYPGYKFKVVDCMLTNFHLPKSTPLFLVSALIGREKLLDIYKEAIQEGYRFFSYGDAMLII